MVGVVEHVPLRKKRAPIVFWFAASEAHQRQLFAQGIGHVGRDIPLAKRKPAPAHGKPEPITLSQRKVGGSSDRHKQLGNRATENRERRAEWEEHNVPHLVEHEGDPSEPGGIQRLSEMTHARIREITQQPHAHPGAFAMSPGLELIA